MVKYLSDTSLTISYLRGFAPARDLILRYSGNIIISYVSIAELFQGVHKKTDFNGIKNLLEFFDIHWGSDKVNKLAIELLERYRLSHGAELVDMLLAATALSANLILLTDNIKDFRFIPGLKVQKPPYA
jgi:tRNA(fMet)-specific endonuclease VapC